MSFKKIVFVLCISFVMISVFGYAVQALDIGESEEKMQGQNEVNELKIEGTSETDAKVITSEIYCDSNSWKEKGITREKNGFITVDTAKEIVQLLEQHADVFVTNPEEDNFRVSIDSNGIIVSTHKIVIDQELAERLAVIYFDEFKKCMMPSTTFIFKMSEYVEEDAVWLCYFGPDEVCCSSNFSIAIFENGEIARMYVE